MNKDIKIGLILSAGLIALSWGLMWIAVHLPPHPLGPVGEYTLESVLWVSFALTAFPLAILICGIWAGRTQEKWYRLPQILLAGSALHLTILGLFMGPDMAGNWGWMAVIWAVSAAPGLLAALLTHYFRKKQIWLSETSI